MSEQAAFPERVTARVIWSYVAPARLNHLKISAESGHVWAADTRGQLYVFSPTGDLLARRALDGGVIDLSVCGDSSRAAVLTGAGELEWLDPSLQRLRCYDAPEKAHALAIDPLGYHAAVACSTCAAYLADFEGRELAQFQTYEPLHRLVLPAEVPNIVGTAGYGTVQYFNPRGRSLWRDTIHGHLGGMAVTADAGVVLVAAYTFGIQRYSGAGVHEGTYYADGTCRLVACSWLGDMLVASTMEGNLMILNQYGQQTWQQSFPNELDRIDLDGAGQRMVYCDPAGQIVMLEWVDEEQPPPCVAPPVEIGPRIIPRPRSRQRIFVGDEALKTAEILLGPAGEWLAAVGPDRKLRLYNAAGAIQLHTEPIRGRGARLVTDRQGKWLVVVTAQKGQLTDTTTLSCVAAKMKHFDLLDVVMDPEGQWFITLEDTRWLHCNDTTGASMWHNELRVPAAVWALDQNSRRLWIIDESGNLAGVDGQGNWQRLGQIPPAGLVALLWHQDMFCVVRAPGQVEVIQRDGTPVWQTQLPGGIRHVLQAPDGFGLLTEQRQLWVYRWTGELLGTHEHVPQAVTLMSEGQLVVAQERWLHGVDAEQNLRWRFDAGHTIAAPLVNSRSENVLAFLAGDEVVTVETQGQTARR